MRDHLPHRSLRAGVPRARRWSGSGGDRVDAASGRGSSSQSRDRRTRCSRVRVSRCVLEGSRPNPEPVRRRGDRDRQPRLRCYGNRRAPGRSNRDPLRETRTAQGRGANAVDNDRSAEPGRPHVRTAQRSRHSGSSYPLPNRQLKSRAFRRRGTGGRARAGRARPRMGVTYCAEATETTEITGDIM